MLKLLFLTVFATATLAFALGPDRTIAQFYHTAWTIEDGVPDGIEMLAQTRDGYLWLGSSHGLFRFDGVRFERYQPERGDPFPSQEIFSLLATPDGGLWIGFRTGGATFLANGRGHNYGEREGLPASSVNRFALDHEGAMWAGTNHGLFRFKNSRWESIGTEWGFFAQRAGNLFVDNQGKFWVNGNTDLYCLSPGEHIFQMRKLPHRWVIRQTPDGTRWLLEETSGVRAVSGPLAESNDVSRAALKFSIGTQLLVDRDGSFWMSTAEQDGVRRVSQPEQLPGSIVESTSGLIQRFTYQDGLSSDAVRDMLEDREGNIWIATRAGLDRFRRKNVVEGPFPHPTTAYTPLLVTDREGIIWEGSGRTLLTLASDRASVRAGPQLAQPPGFLNNSVAMTCAWREFGGAIWLGGRGTLSRWVAGRIKYVEFPDKDLAADHSDVQSITGSRTGDLWVSIDQHGVYRRHDGVWTQYGKLLGLPAQTAIVLWTDPTDRVWLGYRGNQVVLVDGDQVRTFSSPDGLHVGNVLAIGGRGDHIWAAGQFGLALFDGKRFHTIAGEADSDFRGVSGVVETAGGDFWLNQATGLARIPAAGIANRLRDPHHGLQYDLFDFRDGVRGTAAQLRPLPSAVQASDGRIWISGSNGVYWVDPAHIYKNPTPPPVTIEAIDEGDQRFSAFEAARLAKLPQSVRIEYTALSLSIPERVRFRYQLEGYDKDWQDVGNRREAIYTNLGPRHYRFRVIACNDDGVWNNEGAAIEFTIAPAWYQTLWFRLCCGAASLLVLWAAYLLRIRQLKSQFAARLEVRADERTRIARELHDTLLQSFQGAVFQFQAARRLFLRNADNVSQVMDEAIQAAEEGITEGRAAIHELRPESAAQRTLPELLNAVGHELAGIQEPNAYPPNFRVTVEGKERGLSLMVQDEVYRIARELIRNAFHHSAASLIEVEVRYDHDQLRVRIRDDGKGIDRKVLTDGGQSGHWGIPGMRERAQRIGSRLEFWSEMGAGTEVELTVPAAMAYEKRRDGLRL